MTSRYLDVQDSVRDHASSPVVDFLDNMDTMFRAVFDWSLHTIRNRRPDTAFDTTTTTVRPRVNTEPLPFEAVSCWWDPALTNERETTFTGAPLGEPAPG